MLANLTCNAQATTSLILKSGLLTWIEMQLIDSTSNLHMESVQWIKILDNILVIVKPDKIEAATNGEWRMIVSRCLCHLLDENHGAIFIFSAFALAFRLNRLQLTLWKTSPTLSLSFFDWYLSVEHVRWI